jgi:hypothetical protein
VNVVFPDVHWYVVPPYGTEMSVRNVPLTDPVCVKVPLIVNEIPSPEAFPEKLPSELIGKVPVTLIGTSPRLITPPGVHEPLILNSRFENELPSDATSRLIGSFWFVVPE